MKCVGETVATFDSPLKLPIIERSDGLLNICITDSFFLCIVFARVWNTRSAFSIISSSDSFSIGLLNGC